MNKYKVLYEKGFISKEQLQKIVKLGVLTNKEYNLIVKQ